MAASFSCAAWRRRGTLLGPEPHDLVGFFQFLAACNTRLEADQRWLVLGIDEFEELDRGIGLKQFMEDFAATLRESVQSHRLIIWVFAGSHQFNDLPNVQWSSYLVSLRTLELPPFTPEETRLVLSQPLKHAGGWRIWCNSWPRRSWTCATRTAKPAPMPPPWTPR